MQEGKLRAIGISNFYVDRFVEFCNFACNDWTRADGTIVKGIRPAVNQIEIHPYHTQSQQLEWMQKYGVQPEAWAPLNEGRNGIFNDPVLLDIASNHGKSLHQVVLRWQDFHLALFDLRKIKDIVYYGKQCPSRELDIFRI